MKKISVIIPIYNTRKELPKCLSSICNQTYENLEIICVDDGSSDGSEGILDEFSKKDSRIVAIHQKNAGESNARNVGLKRATGDYIAFCDCDDWIDEEMYQTLVSVMEAEELDLVASGWYREETSENGFITTEIKNVLPVSKEIIPKSQLLQYIYMRDSYRGFAYMWNKLYKREILHNKCGELLLFDEDLRLGGDVIYLAEVALNAERARYIDKAFYHYYQRSVSGCHTKDLNKLRDWLRAYEYVISRFEEENVDVRTVDYVKRFMAYHSSNAAELAYEQRDINLLRVFQGFMKQYEQEYVSLNLQYTDRVERYKKILNL